MTATQISPNTGNYQVGKGIVSFKKAGTDFFRDLGNVTDMTVTPDLTTLDHFSSRTGTKSKDLTIILEKACTCKLTMEEITAENVALMVLGTVDPTADGGPTVEIFSENSVSGWLKFVGENDVGPRVTVDLYNVSFNPSGDFELISDEFNAMEATADVLVSQNAPNVGKFGIIQFTNVAADVIPVVSSLSVTTGVAAGGTATVITGTGFLDVSQVLFGAVEADFVVTDATHIAIAATPPHAAGAVTVTVINEAGASTPLAAAFTYT